MKIPIHIAEKLWRLSQGESLASSQLKHRLVEELVEEGIVERRGRIQKKIILLNSSAFFLYLQNKYAINDLQQYIEIIQKEDATRAELVAISSNSKLNAVRTFKGFLINCYSPVLAKLNGNPMTIHPVAGTFQFIYDFENFVPSKDITIVGIENPENFRYIEKQAYLFKDIQPLFVSRYPQNQSKDLIKWLQSIPNDYLHFGDFDFAGIGIYLHEFKKHLGEKSSFFVPDNIEKLLAKNGNKTRYDQQKINFRSDLIQEEKVLDLIRLIHQYRKGLDQEILINKE